ncbi:hypothetical protein MPSEU_000381900 [Mayamaea pseudoterrestris]|nr:hypothetical protein MPSEU_000381900 [Mayamaea pseudoterrestris]
MSNPGSYSFPSAEDLVDRLLVMQRQEETAYAYKLYLPPIVEANSHLNNTWREKICQWAYNVVDHFDLSREVVAVSLDLFDRYLAGVQCNGNLALLTSLTTLAIAIKLYDPKRIKIATLSNLSRGQFGPTDIEAMEFKILSALKWRIHPPTQYAFVSHLVLFLTDQVHPSVRKDIFEMARYLTELAVCDSYFIAISNSTVALAAILNVFDDTSYSKVPASTRERFIYDIQSKLGLDCRHPTVTSARGRLRTMFVATEETKALERVDTNRPATVSPTPPRSERFKPPEQQLLHHVQDAYDARSVTSTGSMRSGRHSRNNSFDSQKSCRYSPSPRHFCLANAAGGSRAHVSSSAIVAGVM